MRATKTIWKNRINEWRKSGLTLEQFAQREGLKARTLAWWRWKLSEAHPELRVNRDARETKLQVVELSPDLLVGGEHFEVALHGGRRVIVPAGFDAHALGRLLDVLEGAR